MGRRNASDRREKIRLDGLLNFMLLVNTLNFQSAAFVISTEESILTRNSDCATWNTELTCLF